LASRAADDRLTQIRVADDGRFGANRILCYQSPLARDTLAGIAVQNCVSFDQCGHVAVEKTAEFVPVVEAFLDGAAGAPR